MRKTFVILLAVAAVCGGLVHEKGWFGARGWFAAVSCTKRGGSVHERWFAAVSCTKRGGLVHEGWFGALIVFGLRTCRCRFHGGPG